MKKLLFILLFCPIIGLAQGGFKKGVREGDAYRIVTNDGIQFNFGATYQMTPKTTNYQSLLTVVGAPKGFIDPQGKLGFFAEFGMAHFPKWKGLVPIKFLKKSRLMDYVDWGIGYKQFAGSEKTNIVQGNPSVMGEGTGSFKNGFVYGRFSAHSLIYVGKKKIDVARKYFIDNAIGFNFDYNIMRSDEAYQNGINLQPFDFHRKFQVQFHYSIGVGIRFNRAWMMVPNITLPLIGIRDYNGINGRMNWFSSTYWPIHGQIKFIKLFERPPKCGVYGDPSDKEKEKGFRMNY
jgi:hypothetical protein